MRRDTVLRITVPSRADSLRIRDSLARDSAIKADTIKAPIARAEMPPLIGIASPFRWNRAELFASGALTVQDLLDRMPGVTTMRSGWIASPSVGAFEGDVRRVRVFIDGVERDAIDPRSDGVLDLTQIALWSFEEAEIERGAGEVRVHLRTWRVNNTTPYTRTDIATGDQQTNLYRGFFGKRGHHGEVVQFAAQQFGTTPPSRFGSSADQLGLFGRLGIAQRGWSVDAAAHRTGQHRGVITNEFADDSISGLDATRTDAYLRVAYGDADTSATWAQLLASGTRYEFKPNLISALGVPDTIQRDTTRFRSQYLLTVGGTGFGIRVSATERFRSGAGLRFSSPSLRASYVTGPLAVSAYLNGKGTDSVAHSDITARVTPLPFLSFVGSVGRSTSHRSRNLDELVNDDSSVNTSYVRGEIGLRIRDLWIIGGVMHRDSALLPPPVVFNRGLITTIDGPATAATLAIRGRIWKALYADAMAIRWTDTTGMYRPQYQTRSELFISTQLLNRFPSGNLSLLGSITHEYRSGTRFPFQTDVVTVPGYRTISSLVEIRIMTATVSWQFRNFLGERYTQALGFAAPRQTNFYGVRWDWWN